MLDQNDIRAIKEIVGESIQRAVGPIASDVGTLKSDVKSVKDDLLRMDGKIDALARVTDRRFEEVLAAFNAYATVTDRRLLRLETHVGIV